MLHVTIVLGLQVKSRKVKVNIHSYALKYANTHIRLLTHKHNGSTSHKSFKEASERSQ